MNPNVIKKEILVTEDCSFCTYLDRRIVRRLAFLQLKRKKWRKTRVNWCCLTVEGALNLAARIAFRSGYENFPTRPPGFFSWSSFLFSTVEKDAASNVEQAIDLLETRAARSRGTTRRSHDDRLNVENGRAHALLRSILAKHEVDIAYSRCCWYTSPRILWYTHIQW